MLLAVHRRRGAGGVGRHRGPGAARRTAARRRDAGGPRISVMLIVPDGGAAVSWYREALGADVLWDLGGVAGLEVAGAPFFLHEANPDNPTENSPDRVGQTSVRVEVFVDDPDAFIERAVAAGARQGSPVTAHELPWGTHRQGGFHDPFGHRWSVGDTSPLRTAERLRHAASATTPVLPERPVAVTMCSRKGRHDGMSEIGDRTGPAIGDLFGPPTEEHRLIPEITYDEHLYPARPRRLRPSARRVLRDIIRSGLSGATDGTQRRPTSSGWSSSRCCTTPRRWPLSSRARASMWQNPFAHPDPRAAVERAAVWFTAYPLSFITRSGESFLSGLADAGAVAGVSGDRHRRRPHRPGEAGRRHQRLEPHRLGRRPLRPHQHAGRPDVRDRGPVPRACASSPASTTAP